MAERIPPPLRRSSASWVRLLHNRVLSQGGTCLRSVSGVGAGGRAKRIRRVSAKATVAAIVKMVVAPDRRHRCMAVGTRDVERDGAAADRGGGTTRPARTAGGQPW